MAESRSFEHAVPAPVHHDRPVLVTGGAGFLGREVVRQLLAGGCRDVRVVDLVESEPREAPGLRAWKLDLLRDDLAAPFQGAATILHLAACQYHSRLAPDPYDLPFHAINVEGTRRVIEAARAARAERLVFASSSMVYGIPRALPIREDHPREPLGPYGRAKLEAERLVEAASGPSLATVILRPAPIFGPGRTGVVTRVFDRILDGRPVAMIGSGRNRQELIACEDCARLVLLAGREAAGHAAYNVGSAGVPTMREWMAALIADAGSPSTLTGTPALPIKLWLRALEAARRSPLRREQYEIADRDYWLDSGAAKTIGWTPLWNGVDAALALFRWHRDRRGSAGSPPSRT